MKEQDQLKKFENAPRKIKCKEKYNWQPILPISLDHVVPDILHRITDVLINLELRRLILQKVNPHSIVSTLKN